MGSAVQANSHNIGLLSKQFAVALKNQLSIAELKRRTLFENIFGTFDSFGLISIGGEHPDLQKPFPRLHPDNIEAVLQMLSLLETEEVDVKNGIFEIHSNSFELGHNIVSIGSAKSTLTTRLLEGYRGSDARYLTRDRSVHLRWEFLVDERKLSAISKRYLEGKEWIRPNHELIDNESKDYNNNAPILDFNGWLKEDFMLVSKLPNNITADAIHIGSYGIIIEGSHGIGTRGLELLVNNKDMLIDLRNKINDNRYWQALYKVKVEHDDVTRTSYPHSIKPISCNYISLL